jgi:hypothetical protein
MINREAVVVRILENIYQNIKPLQF